MKKLWVILFFLIGVAPAHAIILDTTSKTVEVITGSAVSTIEVNASWDDVTTSAFTPGSSSAAITTATTTTVVASPGASTQRQVKLLTIYDSHASSSNAITIQTYDGTNRRIMMKYTLLAGETIQYVRDQGFRVLDASGNVKVMIGSVYDSVNTALRVTGVTVQSVSGNTAHDAANTQAPVIVGGHASSSVNGETLVTAGDVVRWHFGRDGVPVVQAGCAREDIVSAVVTSTAGANTSGIAAQGAGVKVYLSQIIIYNNGASNGSMIVTDGSGGTTKVKVPFPASTGTTINLALPVAFSANTAIFVDPSGSDNIDVTLIGCKSQL